MNSNYDVYMCRESEPEEKGLLMLMYEKMLEIERLSIQKAYLGYDSNLDSDQPVRIRRQNKFSSHKLE